MTRSGFTSFDNPVPPAKTVPEILALMTGQQKGWVLEAFSQIPQIHPSSWRQWVQETYPTEFAADNTINKVPRKVINTLYHAIRDVDAKSRELMRGEILLKAEVKDSGTGEIITPAVYNTPPTTTTGLKNAMADEFVDMFTATQVTAVLSAMVKASRIDGSGTWAYYKAEVIK